MGCDHGRLGPLSQCAPVRPAGLYCAGRGPSNDARTFVKPFWIKGQNNAIRPSAMIVLTSPLDQNTLRLPCEASSDCRNPSSALSPSTMASTIGAKG